PLVVLECSRLLLLDAAGMSAVVVGARILGAAGGRLVVVGATRSVRRVLRLTRVAEAVPMFSTMHEALVWQAALQANVSGSKGSHRRLRTPA
ncbi:MAG TPA: STAS domain-containing protein, partial [Acidimicrobiales bacterium]|nr:STAS domain-containing protein [Acidimicrobiales bacterium]